MLGVKVRVLLSHYIAGTNAALHQKCDILCVVGKNEIYFIRKYVFFFFPKRYIEMWHSQYDRERYHFFSL